MQQPEELRLDRDPLSLYQWWCEVMGDCGTCQHGQPMIFCSTCEHWSWVAHFMPEVWKRTQQMEACVVARQTCQVSRRETDWWKKTSWTIYRVIKHKGELFWYAYAYLLKTLPISMLSVAPAMDSCGWSVDWEGYFIWSSSHAEYCKTRRCVKGLHWHCEWSGRLKTDLRSR